MPAARMYPAVAFAAILAAACSKSEPPSAPKSQPQAAAPATPVAPAKSGEIDEGLKERLARQEAAARMFESKVLSPPPPPASIPTAPATQPAPSATPTPPPKAEPPRADAPKVDAPRADAPKVDAPKVESTKAAPKAESPKALPPKVEPPARTDLAAARPAPAPEPPATLRLVSRVDPEFPREAASSGYEQGNVKARMTLDASGSVTRVEILAANPRRVFDRAVVRALSQWRYNEGPAGRTVDMEVEFRR